MDVQTRPVMTPAQSERNELQVQWLIAALRVRPSEFLLDERSLRVGKTCPTCGAKWGAHETR
jgi:hypothetical protein